MPDVNVTAITKASAKIVTLTTQYRLIIFDNFTTVKTKMSSGIRNKDNEKKFSNILFGLKT